MSEDSLTLVLLKTKKKEHLTYGKGIHKIWENHSFRRFYYASKALSALSLDKVIGRHSWCSQFHLQRLTVGRDHVSHVWRVPLWRWLRGRCQQKRVPPAGITWNPDTDEPHNRACHKGTNVSDLVSNGLKAQWAHSPGQAKRHPGYYRVIIGTPWKGKSIDN